MRGILRVSRRTVAHRSRASPTSIKATYLPIFPRSISDDGRHKVTRSQGARSPNPNWVGQEGMFSKTVTVPNVSSVDESALLAALRGWSSQDGRKAAEAVFLVTPNLAHLFEPGSTFLKDAMTRIYGKDLMSEVFSLVAVVDKIPGQWMVEEHRIRDCEGISVMLKSPTPSPFKKHHRSDFVTYAPVLGSTSSRGFLEFRSALGPLVPNDTRNAEVVYRVATANTLFVNGRRTTMFYTRWEKSSETLQAKQSRDLSVFRFFLRHKPRYMEVSSIPLVPLTKPRAVIRAMGNIISEIQVSDKVVPASTELEAAVMNSIRSVPKEHALEPQTRVYAYISGSRVQEDASAQPEGRPQFTGFVQELKSAAGLYQVIGGGGGWGNKRGLLALDPVNPSIDTARECGEDDINGEHSIKAPNTETSLAAKGQNIQFYQLEHNLIRARDPSVVEDAPNPQSAENMSLYLVTKGTMWDLAHPLRSELGQQHIMVGTIPTQDVETVSATLDQRAPRHQLTTELWGVFGALSETGIQMEMYKYPFQNRIHKYPLQEDLNKSTTSQETGSAETIVRTISVPHSYVAFKTLGPPTSPEQGRFGKVHAPWVRPNTAQP